MSYSCHHGHNTRLMKLFFSEDFKLLLSRAEAAILRKKDKMSSKDDDGEESKNPPPSPATDGRDNSSDAEELGNSPAPVCARTPSPSEVAEMDT